MDHHPNSFLYGCTREKIVSRALDRKFWLKKFSLTTCKTIYKPVRTKYITSNYRQWENELLVSSIVEVSVSKIALWIYVHVGKWTVERAIIADNVKLEYCKIFKHLSNWMSAVNSKYLPLGPHAPSGNTKPIFADESTIMFLTSSVVWHYTDGGASVRTFSRSLASNSVRLVKQHSNLFLKLRILSRVDEGVNDTVQNHHVDREVEERAAEAERNTDIDQEIIDLIRTKTHSETYTHNRQRFQYILLGPCGHPINSTDQVVRLSCSGSRNRLDWC